MTVFGDDFEKAKSNWLYDAVRTLDVWKVVLIVVGLLIAHSVLQNVTALIAISALYKDVESVDGATAISQAFKSAVVGMFPAAAVSSLLAYYVSKRLDRDGQTMLPMHFPKLGLVGWIVVLVGFAVTMYAVFIATFTALGIDPATYTPGGGGAGDNSNNSGMVEKALADLADEPFLFALAIPGVAIAVPLAEELIFRGILFSAILHSPLGKWGAVLITAALFALMHAMAAPWLFVWIIFVMAILLGLLLLRFGSLWVPIACHMLWNSLNVVMLMLGINTP